MEPNNNELLEQDNIQNENVVNPSNEMDSTQTVETQNENSDKNNLKFLIWIFVAFIVIVAVGVLAVTVFKSDEQKFAELLTKDQAVVEFFEDLTENSEKLMEKYEQIDSIIEIDVEKIAKELDEDIDQDFLIALNSSDVIKGEDVYGKLKLNLNTDYLISLEYAKTGDLYGVRVKEGNEKFIAVENKNLQKLFEKFEIPDAEMMPDRFLTQQDFEKVMKMDSSDIEKIFNKYMKVFAKSIEGKVKVEKGVELSFGDKKVKTTKYSIDLTEKVGADILMAIIEELKDDKKNIELVMTDVKAILKLMEDNGYSVEDMYGFEIDEIPSTEKIMESIDDLYKELKEYYDEVELDDEEVVLTLSVHKYKGKNIATQFKDDYEVITFKFLNDKDELYAAFVVEDEGEEGEGAEFIVQSKVDKKTIDIDLIAKEENEELGKISIDGTKDGDNWEAKLAVKADDFNVECFTLKQEYKKKAEEFVKLDNENSLILNNADMDELETYGEEFMENLTDWAEKLSKTMDSEAFGDLMNELMILNSQPTTTTGYSVFSQEFGDYALNFQNGPLADVQMKYGMQGIALTGAQSTYLAATGKELDTIKGVMIPEGVEFVTELNKLSDPNLYSYSEIPVTGDCWGNGDVTCWEIKDSQISGYRDNYKFYGDNLGREKHFVTENGFVFTLPGYPREVDGEYRMYISPDVYYNADSNFSNVINVKEDEIEYVFDGMPMVERVPQAARFSTFAQEFGDYALNFQIDPLADVQIQYGMQGIALTRAQSIYLAATGQELDTIRGVMIPEGVEFVTELNKLSDPNLYNSAGIDVTAEYWGETVGNGTQLDTDIACWEIDDSQISGYSANHLFYGDNLGKEKHFVTEKGFVFTLPGYPREVDGEYRMYISPDVYYKTNQNLMGLINATDFNVVGAHTALYYQ